MKTEELFEQSIEKIKKLKPNLAKAAQEVYNEWDQDAEGYDELLGYGGVCQNIAEKISYILSMQGFESATVDSHGVGEQHVWVVVKTDEGVYSVDIDPYVYETGSGYTWKKKENVIIDSSDIDIDKLSNNPDEFSDYVD